MDLTRVDLNLLVALDALLSEESVTQAAARLQVGQSAMSATLARIRKLFDDPILVKQGRNLTPTPFAMSLQLPLAEALTQVKSLLAAGTTFNPALDRRDFHITANDYVGAVFLQPLLVRLATEAPHVRIHIRPVQDDFAERLRRGDTDLMIMPKEVFPAYASFPHQTLFSDRYICAVDADNTDVGDTLTAEQFSQQPYLAVTVGNLPSSAEMQLDAIGIHRNTHFSTQTFILAPFLLRGTRLLALIQERLARSLASQTNLRLLEPPMSLAPMNMAMLWAAQNKDDSGQLWLRNRIQDLATELFGNPSI